jgi:transketolase
VKLLDPNEKVLGNAMPVWHDSFGELVRSHPDIVALTADLSRSVCTEKVRVDTPERYFNIGIAEQDMVGIAAGLALSGKTVYCATIAPFATMRACEQFRTDVCYMNLNVRMVGKYGGITNSGPTHSGLEDAGIVRGMANSCVVCPSDVGMIPKMFEASYHYRGPMYIRMASGSNEGYIYGEDYKLEIGKALIAREGGDATVISFGMVLRSAVEAANQLTREGIHVGIVDMHTLKPLDKEAILKAARDTKRIVTVEDHSVYNGLGSAVAEVLAESGERTSFRRLGIPDIFPAYGDPLKLRDKYGFGAKAIAEAVKSML